VILFSLQKSYNSNSDDPDKRSFGTHVVIMMIFEEIPSKSFFKIFVLMYGTKIKLVFCDLFSPSKYFSILSKIGL